MLLFNFKLFFKIAVALLTGTTVSTTETSKAETNTKADQVFPANETIDILNKQDKNLNLVKWDEIQKDSMAVNIQDENKKVSPKNLKAKN